MRSWTITLDPEILFKEETDKEGNEYYTYIIVYVDDLIIVDKKHWKYMAMLESKYTLKLYSFGDPKVYFGSNLGKILYGYGSNACTMSSDSYVK